MFDLVIEILTYTYLTVILVTALCTIISYNHVYDPSNKSPFSIHATTDLNWMGSWLLFLIMAVVNPLLYLLIFVNWICHTHPRKWRWIHKK